MSKDKIDSLINIHTDPTTGRLTANWNELPPGPWTRDIDFTDPDDSELAALSIIAYRNLKRRSKPDDCVKIWGIGEGMATTLWDASDEDREKVSQISRLAVLLSTQPIPRKP